MRRRSWGGSLKHGALMALAVSMSGAMSGECASASAHDRTEQILVGEFHRTYRLHLPPVYDGTIAVPLVLVFHGRFQSPQDIEAVSHFSTVADREGFIVVYPEGMHQRWNDGRRAPDRSLPMIYDDVGFVAALVAHLQAAFAIDSSRIYATGMSNGATFVQRLGCELSDTLAAIGPVSGTLPVNVARGSTTTQPLPVVEFHGTDDAYIRWKGGTIPLLGGRTLSVPDTIAYWRRRNGCTGAPTMTKVPHQYSEDKTRVRREVWDTCQRGGDVTLYTIEGGGHMWPGGPDDSQPFTGHQSYDVSAAEVLWAFFAQHPKAAATSLTPSAPSSRSVAPPPTTTIPPPVVPIGRPTPELPLPLTIFQFLIKADFLKSFVPLLARP